jgi:uncharacterized membrane protein YedE/YeeE
MIELIRQPWPWYVAGVVIGLTVPALLLLGNKHLGISSSLRHLCAACFPANISFFKYNWKREIWNLFFVGGVLIGSFLAVHFLSDPAEIVISEKTVSALQALNVQVDGNLMPASIFSFQNVFTLQGLIFFVVGGFMVGFGTRYAGGCTSGHTIMGISNLQWPSVVASCFFMLGGFMMVQVIFPWLMNVL